MFKLLQICVEGNTGSTGRLAESIGDTVIKYGGTSFIAHGRFTRKSSSNIIKIGNNFDIYLHGLETRIFDNHGFGSRNATLELINKIKIIQPQIIHLHHLHGYYINIEILFKYLSSVKIPIIWTFHDCWSITGHCTNFDFVGCERWKTKCYKCPQKHEYPASILFDRSQKNFEAKKKIFNSIENLTIVSVSNWLDNIVAKSFLSNQNRKMIYNGINLDIFYDNSKFNSVRIEHDLSDKFIILGVASPWTNKKGFNDFIDLSKLIGDNIIIILIGLNEKQIQNLPQNIIGIKKTENQSQLVNYYSSANLFVNFSVEETFGLTTAEALACGTPALVYNTTASPEIIDNETGFVAEPKDYNTILNCIKIVMINGKEFYNNKCRKRAVKLFNINHTLSEYMMLYQKKIHNE